jgi:leucyl-tRNA synthetase
VLKWYLRRTAENPNKELMKKAIETQLLLLAPFAPFYCEEIWEKIGNKKIISLATWPKFAIKKINSETKIAEETIRKTIEDIAAVQKITGKTKPNKIMLYIAPKWKQTALKQIIALKTERIDFGTAMKAIMKKKELQEKSKEIPGFITAVLKRLQDYRQAVEIKELLVFEEAKNFFEKEFNCAVLIEKSETTNFDPANKAKNAMPLKPAIYLE